VLICHNLIRPSSEDVQTARGVDIYLMAVIGSL